MTKAFRLTTKLRFAHCDPAGIGYYPRYLELCDAAIEDWTAATLGVPRQVMHLEMRLGLPTVDLHARFSAPSRLGDLLDIDISVGRVGRSSIQLAAAVSCAGEPRFDIDYVQVLTRLDTMQAAPWPVEWRERLASSTQEENRV
jgi:4-hydroxybenzoyl-CoA thioesterase